MRTFIAIALPKECQAMLEKMQQNLRRSDADVRWATIPSIHLTLKFLGDADPAIIPSLAESLRKISASGRSLALRLRGLGCFPTLHNPRVVWCGIDGDMEELSVLQKKVEIVCAEFGFPIEDRPFSPHLTLGRFRSRRNLQQISECIKIGSDLECSFNADVYNIYRSILKPQGAIYNVLETIKLI
jgi:2'-5' RNA ligase